MIRGRRPFSLFSPGFSCGEWPDFLVCCPFLPVVVGDVWWVVGVVAVLGTGGRCAGRGTARRARRRRAGL